MNKNMINFFFLFDWKESLWRTKSIFDYRKSEVKGRVCENYSKNDPFRHFYYSEERRIKWKDSTFNVNLKQIFKLKKKNQNILTKNIFSFSYLEQDETKSTIHKNRIPNG